jgi:phosphatidate cytidylyltransferase
VSWSAPAPGVIVTYGGILAGLVLASAVVLVLRRRRPGGASDELWARVRSWWTMALVFGAALLLGRTVSLLFFAFLSFLAFKEYLSLVPTRRADRRMLFWAYLSIPVQYLWVGMAWYGMFAIWIPVYVFLLLPLRMVLIGDTRGFLKAAGMVHWGLMTTVFSLSHVAYLLVLPAAITPEGGGVGLVLFLVLLTELNDVAQYLWGKALGRRRIVPAVSPNKTVAGFAGGVVTTLAVSAALAPWLTPLGRAESVAIGAMIGVAGFVGDVVVSAIKRDLGVKDAGRMLPGHGGILDRLDSLTYTAPLFFHVVRYFHY